MYIKNNCAEWSLHIEDWKKKHTGEALPKYFIAYVRVGGLIERGGPDGRVLVTPLPVILLAPGARPPTQSNLDVSEFDLVNSTVNRNSMLFGDGARAWRKAALDAGLCKCQPLHPRILSSSAWFESNARDSWHSNLGQSMARFEEICSLRDHSKG